MLPESPNQPGRSLPPGHCPRCHRVNLHTVQACLWCQCPLTPSVVLPSKRSRLPLLGVVALIAVVGGGAKMLTGRSEPDRNLTAAAQATTLTRPAASPASSATPPTSTPPSGSTAPSVAATPTAIPPQQLVDPAPVVRKRKVRRRIVRRVVARQDSQAEVAAQQATAQQTQADSNVPTTTRSSFSAEVDEWVTQIFHASDPTEERRIGRQLLTRKWQLERARAFHRAQVIDRLLLAIETRHAPNPVVQQSWTAHLGTAQTRADEIERDENATPAQRTQESRDLSQRMMDWERQAARRAPPRR